MKKTVFTLGGISMFIICLGSLFKVLYLPGANLITASGFLLILIAIPLMFTYLYSVSK